MALVVSLAAASKTQTMAYTSILYGAPRASPHHRLWTDKRRALTCLVAASGMQLARMDHLRERVLVVNDIVGANATGALLEAAGWRLRVVDFEPRDPTGQNRTFSFPKWEDGRRRLLDDARELGRKNRLWDLRNEKGALYERALFFDADTLFLDTVTNRGDLAALWRLPRGKLLALPVKHSRDCFSTSIMLYEPDERQFERLNAFLWDQDNVSLAHCPGHDQRILNSVFGDRWSRLNVKKTSPESAGHPGSVGLPLVVHFHGKAASPYISRVWEALMRRAPDVFRDHCAGLYPA